MKWYGNLKISAKLLSGFILVALIAGAVGAFGMVNIKILDDKDTYLYEQMTVPLGEMIIIAESFQRARGNVRDILLAETAAEIDDYAQRIEDRMKDIDTNLTSYKTTLFTEEGKALSAQMESDIEAYHKVALQAIEFVRNGQKEQAHALVKGQGNELRTSVEKAYRRMMEIKVQTASETAASNTELANRTMQLMGGMVAVAMALAVGLGIFISKIISKPLNRAVTMITEMGQGHLGTRLNMDSKDEIGVMAGAMDAFAEDLQQNVVGLMKQIAAGDVTAEVVSKDDKDEISPALKTTIETIRSLVADTDALIKATQMGQLDTRGNASKYQGSWRELVGGVNGLIDAFVAPINVTAEYVERIGKGDIPAKITDVYYGDFNEIKNSINSCIENVNALVEDARMLEQAAIEGRLSTRADASRHGGDFRKIVEGVNNCLDAVIGPLNVAADYVDRISKGNIPPVITDTYHGDFNTIKNNLNDCVAIMNGLLKETNLLIDAALEGRLNTRADASGFVGDWKTLVSGFNRILEAVIEPVNEASAVLEQMAQGNLQQRVTGNYKGDHAAIKNAMNDTLDALSSYVTEISYVLNEMANSNLEVSINNEYKGDFAQIKEALNLIIESLNTVLGDINNASEQVASGSRQVSDGSQALSQGATEQAASVEELTASITQVAAQTKQNALNANQANELAVVAKDNAEQGNTYMQGMLKSMTDINESSNNISKIIKVIDEIAFQTNILALNAAVEAARAGQHGKGFAVVAEEVRNLAARSANAAKETTAMIEGSIKKVEDGTKIANETAGALEKIVDGVAKAADLVRDIAAASNEQATGIGQINKGIEQVSQVVQTNSATAEQSAAASEELSSQAELLKEMVGKFRLKRAGASRRVSEEPAYTPAKPRKEKKNDGAQKLRISLSDAEFGKY